MDVKPESTTSYSVAFDKSELEAMLKNVEAGGTVEVVIVVTKKIVMR